ncbi:GLPGLI family protein [Olleya sp. YS]|uniref:GLPGLI family protein n=1 Tax=Olleya sp. YS TaxID=3028318 RepID=UPI0024344083|nr:GLPGLI family protein [Olleya sp. YS]WGD34619.1 GLPGLI family protein [Olleya sp. YS]
MKFSFIKISALFLSLLFTISNTETINSTEDFQGKAYYISKSSMDLGRWGARMSEAQKKQIKARLKNRLEKTYILTFNKEEATFKEEDKIDALSGATDSWGKAFTAGEQYRNIKNKTLIQQQDFYGKVFLVKDSLMTIQWKMSGESKTIGQYNCFKATALIPTSDLNWYNFSWSELRNNESKEDDENTETSIEMTQIEAWYSPQIPVSLGPLEYWGLPGLILEVSDGKTTMLCSKIIMNPGEKEKIEAPKKGKEVIKTEYKEIITNKMIEMRNNRGRRRG